MQRFGRQHITGSQTLLISARNQFHILFQQFEILGVRKGFSRSQLLGQFVNTLTAD